MSNGDVNKESSVAKLIILDPNKSFNGGFVHNGLFLREMAEDFHLKTLLNSNITVFSIYRSHVNGKINIKL
jgi:hypothetical protein